MPVIICEGYDVFLFQSLDKAQAYLEPIDVRAGSFRGFDSEGYPLQFSVVRRRLGWRHLFWALEEVRIVVDHGKPRQAEELRVALLTFLGHLKALPEGLDELPLPQLVEISLSRALVDW